MIPGLVSVVIPVFNRKHLLAEAVQSCLAQTYPHIEVIIIDDGSSDGTDLFVNEKISGEWKGWDIRYFKKENQGPSAARQFGMENSRGEFVQFLDSDDIILPDKFMLQVAAMQAVGDVAACCSCYGRKGEKSIGWERSVRVGFKGETVTDYIRAMCMPISFPMSCNAPLWRISFLAMQPGWSIELSCGEDWAYYTRLLTHAHAVAFVDEDLFWARDHEGDRASPIQKSRRDLRKAASFARALQIVEAVVREAGFFDKASQAGLKRITGSIYLLLLEIGSEDEFKNFETYVARLTTNPHTLSIISVVGWFRRLFGTRITLGCVRLYIRRRRI